MLGTAEHIRLIEMFEQEKWFRGRLDKEAREWWPKGQVYQDPQVNELFLAYRRGYAFGKTAERMGLTNSG